MTATERLAATREFLGPELSKEYTGYLGELEAAAKAERENVNGKN